MRNLTEDEKRKAVEKIALALKKRRLKELGLTAVEPKQKNIQDDQVVNKNESLDNSFGDGD